MRYILLKVAKKCFELDSKSDSLKNPFPRKIFNKTELKKSLSLNKSSSNEFLNLRSFRNEHRSIHKKI